MVRNYKRRWGGRPYKYYNAEKVDLAVSDVKKKKLSIRGAAEKYGVPKSTISDKINNKHTRDAGRPKALSNEEERFLIEGIKKMAEWGFPLHMRDIRELVHIYMENKGITDRRFRNGNIPGKEWMRNFISRYKGEISVRLSENIKRVRAAVNHEMINKYFDELEKSLEGVPSANIVNYDETNFSDDPGKIKVVVKRGSKHADRIMDSSKSSVSVMMAAAGSGKLLAPYVVYKAQHLYPAWLENGPPGTAYNRNKSGWFDQTIFEDWFRKIALPYFRSLDGKKILIGDNLSSHVSIMVLQKCMENNIQFILLPPNSTHLCQPLDVAFFHPLKNAWRVVLTEWKKSNRGVFPKSEFPRLLNETLQKVGANVEKNIKAGFLASGLIPVDRQRVLKRLPPDASEQNPTADTSWTSTFVTFLDKARNTNTPSRKNRGKKLNIVPGKGIIPNNETSDEESDLEEPDLIFNDTSSDNSDIPSDNSEEILESEEEHPRASTSTKSYNDNKLSSKTKPTELLPNKFIVVKFETSGKNKRTLYYIAKIILICENDLHVKFLRKKQSSKIGTYFVYPDIEDKAMISKNQVVEILEDPKDLRNKYIFEIANVNMYNMS